MHNLHHCACHLGLLEQEQNDHTSNVVHRNTGLLDSNITKDSTYSIVNVHQRCRRRTRIMPVRLSRSFLSTSLDACFSVCASAPCRPSLPLKPCSGILAVRRLSCLQACQNCTIITTLIKGDGCQISLLQNVAHSFIFCSEGAICSIPAG